MAKVRRNKTNGAQDNTGTLGGSSAHRRPWSGPGWPTAAVWLPGRTYLLQDGCGQLLGQLLLVVPQVTGLILLVLQREEEKGVSCGGLGNRFLGEDGLSSRMLI